MKNLLLTLTLIPLVTFAARPAKPAKKPVYGPAQLWPAYAQFKKERYKAAQRLAAAYCFSSPADIANSLPRATITARLYKQLMSNQVVSLETTAGIDDDMIRTLGRSVQSIFQDYYNNFLLRLLWDELTEIPQIACVDIRDSLLQKLDLSNCPKLDEPSKERLRKAWATPTDIFPKGRNPKNLILPETVAANAAAGSTDNKDHKS